MLKVLPGNLKVCLLLQYKKEMLRVLRLNYLCLTVSVVIHMQTFLFCIQSGHKTWTCIIFFCKYSLFVWMIQKH